MDGPIIAVKTHPSSMIHDTGTLDGYMKAQVTFALSVPELGEEIRLQINESTS